MPSDDTRDSDSDILDRFGKESRIRVLDVKKRRPIGHEIQCISEPSLFLLRSRLASPDEISVGEIIELPSEILGSFSELRLKDLSGSSQQELVSAISDSIMSDPERHLSFYNSAGPMSLKFHAFQLLPGIGNSKAIQMVQKRGQIGWSTFEEVDDACGIESVKLLSERYLKEMEDVAQTPRLLDLLVRKEK